MRMVQGTFLFKGRGGVLDSTALSTVERKRLWRAAVRLGWGWVSIGRTFRPIPTLALPLKGREVALILSY
jgi:hypothetical protein